MRALEIFIPLSIGASVWSLIRRYRNASQRRA